MPHKEPLSSGVRGRRMSLRAVMVEATGLDAQLALSYLVWPGEAPGARLVDEWGDVSCCCSLCHPRERDNRRRGGDESDRSPDGQGKGQRHESQWHPKQHAQDKLPIPSDVRNDTVSPTFELSRGHARHRVCIDTALQYVSDDPLVASAVLDTVSALGAMVHSPELG